MSTQVACRSNDGQNASSDTVDYRRPAYRISEADNAYTVQVDLPGVSRDAADVSTENGLLTIRAARADAVPSDAKVLLQEANFKGYRLTLKLGTQVDPQNIEASLENGVLALQLNKAAEAQSRRITVA